MVARGRLEPATDPDPKFVAASRAEPKKEDGKPTGKYRFISDFRPANVFTEDRPFSLEDNRVTPGITNRSTHAVCKDFSDFFYSFAVDPRDRRFFGARAPATPHPATVGLGAGGHPVDADGGPTYVPGAVYQYTCPPMGWKLSPWFVNKMTRWVVEWTRGKGANVVWYIDDVLLLGARRQPLSHGTTVNCALFQAAVTGV